LQSVSCLQCQQIAGDWNHTFVLLLNLSAFD
jgi:hypothetical protein